MRWLILALALAVLGGVAALGSGARKTGVHC